MLLKDRHAVSKKHDISDSPLLPNRLKTKASVLSQNSLNTSASGLKAPQLHSQVDLTDSSVTLRRLWHDQFKVKLWLNSVTL